MTEENVVTKISVRNLVEFVLRSGDIDAGSSRMDTDAMQEGIRIHKKIQKSMTDYKAEVSLSTDVMLTQNKNQNENQNQDQNDICILLKVFGRADGIFKLNDNFAIDEIKSTYMSVDDMKESVAVHLAQAKCYAYMYALNQNLNEISVQLTYCNIDTEHIKRFVYPFTFAELKTWFNDLVTKYSEWVFLEETWKRTRNKSIGKLKFPFEYRPGQRDFVRWVYSSIKNGKKLFAEAPTGVGKTISTIFPAVWNMGEGKSSRIFYLTAKTIARTVAENTFELLRQNGLKFKSVTITAKEKICVCDEAKCNPVNCTRARGHFDRVNEALYALLTNEEKINRDLILQYAEKYSVCPYELSLDAATFSDAVVCDYNYVFDKRCALKRFFSENQKNDFIFLTDEAHNLLERARDMYSAEIVKEDFLRVNAVLKKNPKTVIKRISKSLTACNNAMLSVKRESGEFSVLKNCDELYGKLRRSAGFIEDLFSDEKQDFEGRDELVKLYFNIKNFIETYENIDGAYKIYADYNDNGDFRIKLLCMEPAAELKKRTDNAGSAIFFSATLLPIKYYTEQLGGTASDPAIYVPSPFSKSNRLVMVGGDISTKYDRRCESEYQKIGKYISEFVSSKKGNYLVFFTSYKMMEDVLQNSPELQKWNIEFSDGKNLTQKSTCEKFWAENEKIKSGLDKIPKKSSDDITLLVQRRSMTERDKESFLESFSENNGSTLVGFTVLGGAFSEGIDLTGDRLIGACVVGTGLPTVGNERELFKSYFDNKNKDGFDYAYLYPGMNRVCQAAGRVIRTDKDIGAILLLDERFLKSKYSSLFPAEWIPYTRVTIGNVKKVTEEFFGRFEE